jgi:oligopeptide/dipeptide ABC transporter ATP-binding protein
MLEPGSVAETTHYAVELSTFWEAVVQPLLWYVVPNGLLNLMTALWLLGELRNRRRLGERVAVAAWVAYSFLAGLALPAITGPLAFHAWRDARRRGHSPRLWLVLCTVFSFVGFIGYRVRDDAASRRMRGGAWSAAAIVWHLLILVGLPAWGAASPWPREHVFRASNLLWLLPAAGAALAAFPAVYGILRPRLHFADVRARFAADGLLDTSSDALVRVERLKTWFPLRGGVFSAVKAYVRAVDGVDFELRRGEVLGLVGESGCGKTTLGRTVLGLIPATAGRVVIDGVDLALVNGAELRAMRSKMQAIFQDPIGSLNPRMTVGAIVREGLDVHRIGSRAGRRREVEELMARVGLAPDALNRYPHEFSGGQRQRIGIARALAMGADFIVCDEPVSSLDVSIQAQIVNLLCDLRREFGMSYLFIAHDLAVVEHISDRIAVMYLGKIVEVAPRDALYARPAHPYTRALMASIAVPDPAARKDAPPLAGDPPSPIAPPPGCRFHPRCPFAVAVCRTEEPRLEPLAAEPGGDRLVACLRRDEIG